MWKQKLGFPGATTKPECWFLTLVASESFCQGSLWNSCIFTLFTFAHIAYCKLLFFLFLLFPQKALLEFWTAYLSCWCLYLDWGRVHLKIKLGTFFSDFLAAEHWICHQNSFCCLASARSVAESKCLEPTKKLHSRHSQPYNVICFSSVLHLRCG